MNKRILAHLGGTARTFEVGDGRGGVAAPESRAGDERRADGDQLQVSSPRCPPGSLLCCRFAKCKPQLKNDASHYSQLKNFIWIFLEDGYVASS